mmetsp:Transcript_35474/g.61304  ORF Transcript_35474/g.61304 Transcript_35474/m.61304 type:complete len:218 (-) Transcript_35474:809-1462(-)
MPICPYQQRRGIRLAPSRSAFEYHPLSSYNRHCLHPTPRPLALAPRPARPSPSPSPSPWHKARCTITRTYLSGFWPTISHIGVKTPRWPPCAQPMPPAWSMICVSLVPFGTNRINSKKLRIRGIRRNMTGLNWKRGQARGDHEGMRGIYHGSPSSICLPVSRATSRASMILKPEFSRALVHTDVWHMSGRPSPTSMSFLTLRCTALFLSYLSVKHHS